ncbi:PREDICTED: DNA-directed RNA polymerase I subunit RPA43 [Dufourea novaeangliae]|uniref:DNA-directed RNA polymerase I subunit RPA43 n=1 Tax=Dufourea novaeangliae TaxID=178035 RepID=A0A154NZB3_DUFNO|nr:PREDICTED: DNA-directed RNA polymerase I subunit RPA43 [Dufourea novaeangliae]KZC05016.1 DNA-directed RNA polymerase I subunit RPA43 [Dufourea novaeangliae]
MKFKTYTGITWSTLELTGLLEDEDSRVFFEKFKKHFGLHPFHLTNLNAALNEILSSNLNSYDTELKGFLLAYKNPKLLTPLGEIFYDTCFIHVDIEAEFYVFRPEVGCLLKGTINKKGLDYIGVLVHKTFNVSIPKPDDKDNWLGESLEIGQEVKFVVTLFDSNSKLPFIRGTLNPDNYLEGCRLSEQKLNRISNQNNKECVINRIESKSKKRKKHTFLAIDSENSSDEDTFQIKKETPTQRKTKKTFEREEVTKFNEDKKVKQINKTIPNMIKEEIMQEYKPEKSTSSKKNIQKKLRDHSSESSVEEFSDLKSHKRISKKLSVVKSQDEIKNIKLEDGDVSEIERKWKKSFSKRKQLDETDSSVDLAEDKHVKSKNISKRLKTTDVDSNETLINIKMEPLNDQYISEVNYERSPEKKKHKKHKHSTKLVLPISDTNGNVEKSFGKCSRKDSESPVQNIRTDSFEITEKASKKISELNPFTCNSNYMENDEDNMFKKKRKKHSKKLSDASEIIMDGFEDIVMKIEKSNDSYDDTIGNLQNDDVEASLHNIKIKKKEFITDSASDEDPIDTCNQNVKQKNSKYSPNKQVNGSECDFSRVKVKIEDCSDS